MQNLKNKSSTPSPPSVQYTMNLDEPPIDAPLSLPGHLFNALSAPPTEAEKHDRASRELRAQCLKHLNEWATRVIDQYRSEFEDPTKHHEHPPRLEITVELAVQIQKRYKQ